MKKLVVSFLMIMVLVMFTACGSKEEPELDLDDYFDDIDLSDWLGDEDDWYDNDDSQDIDDRDYDDNDQNDDDRDNDDDDRDDDDQDDDNGGYNISDDDDEPENPATYGTYSYRPDGMIPHFDELTISDLYPDDDSLDELVDTISRGYAGYVRDGGYSDWEELDPDSLGGDYEGYIGVYYKSSEYSSYDYNEPLADVESWLVIFKNGVWAIYDNGFKKIKDCGVFMRPEEMEWHLFTVNREGEFVHFFEFDTGTMSGDYGGFTRVYELWD